MIKTLNHIGIAVKSLDGSAEIFRTLFGIENPPRETVGEQRVSVAFYKLGAVSLELTEATDPQSPLARFIEKRGEGIHHLSFEVDDLEEELARLKALGVQLIDERPRIGAGGCRIAFLHPKSTNGILIELSEKHA